MAKETIKILQEKLKHSENKNAGLASIANQALKLVNTIQKDCDSKNRRINQCQDIEQDYILAFKHMRKMEENKSIMSLSLLNAIVEVGGPLLIDIIKSMKGECDASK